jgi:carbon starvation protein
MTILLIVAAAGVALWLGGWLYAPLIARVLGERPDRPTPATRINDGRDYVPTRTPIVFAHHYASIAGAGPIIGPIIALYYGWGPALLWIVLGGILLGGVHDFAATHITMREGGKNLAVVARRYLGPASFVMMLVMLVALLVLVCAAFLDLSAKALTSMVDVATLQLPTNQTLFRTAMVDGTRMAIIGGIASTSVVVITAFSPLLGYLYLKRKVAVWICSLLAVAICGLSIGVGLLLPMAVTPLTWKLLISGYVLISAGLPVWLFLQSRDFINVHILYVGILFLIVALIAAGIRGGGAFAGDAAIPMNNWAEASRTMGPGWPVLFVIIACGAVSGFHSLCAGGTTCKQLRTEVAARHVGYYAMLLESFLAVCVVCCAIVGLTLADYQFLRLDYGGSGNPVLTFAMSVGHTASVGLGLPVAYGALGAMLLLEGFLVTTLDTAIRLTRYMIEEGWATLLRRYDVFAAAAPYAGETASAERGAVEMTGAAGLSIERPALQDTPAPPRPIETTGALRGGLLLLRQYWVNSGLAVALMLTLGLGSGYKTLWPIFGSANQLLAALALIVASCWLAARARPVWYTLLPTIFMLATSAWMMIRLIYLKFYPGLPDGGNLPLFVTAIVVLAMTLGIVVTALRRYVLAPAPTAASA